MTEIDKKYELMRVEGGDDAKELFEKIDESLSELSHTNQQTMKKLFVEMMDADGETILKLILSAIFEVMLNDIAEKLDEELNELNLFKVSDTDGEVH